MGCDELHIAQDAALGVAVPDPTAGHAAVAASEYNLQEVVFINAAQFEASAFPTFTVLENDAQFEESISFAPTTAFSGQKTFLPPTGTNESVIITMRATANPIMMKTVGLGIYNLDEKLFKRFQPYDRKMNLNEYRDETRIMCILKGWDRANINTVWLLLTEEIGELASAIRQHTKTFKKTQLKKDRGVDVQMEMGDVFSYLFQLASMLNVDLDDMWVKHKLKIDQKNYIMQH